MLAAKNDHPKVVKFLLDKGADLKIVDMVSSYDLNPSTCSTSTLLLLGINHHTFRNHSNQQDTDIMI